MSSSVMTLCSLRRTRWPRGGWSQSLSSLPHCATLSQPSLLGFRYLPLTKRTSVPPLDPHIDLSVPTLNRAFPPPQPTPPPTQFSSTLHRLNQASEAFSKPFPILLIRRSTQPHYHIHDEGIRGAFSCSSLAFGRYRLRRGGRPRRRGRC